MERLDKIVASHGALTRSQARRVIKSGAVAVNGRICLDPALGIDAGSDRITVNGRELEYEKHIYIMMNKPAGVLSASRAPGERTVIDLLPPELRRAGLFPAGRLDRDTTGFVLITDDGELAHRMLSPKNHIKKTYEALLDGPVGDETAAAFASGLTLEDGTVFLPAGLEVIGGDGALVKITLCEGKYHQIKRMAAAAGRNVLRLKRTKLGGLYLDPALLPGECRKLTGEELMRIFHK